MVNKIFYLTLSVSDFEAIVCHTHIVESIHLSAILSIAIKSYKSGYFKAPFLDRKTLEEYCVFT